MNRSLRLRAAPPAPIQHLPKLIQAGGAPAAGLRLPADRALWLCESREGIPLSVPAKLLAVP
ncbi:hypothetical protein BOSEA31B_10876 [Hyphomicrobiales bacterium]|nr:hypothetical protein BOSEA31B_10876 [Hyphomicrobiales bacterium]CAH1700728.1 hypothetical protein BOSEA1005_20427 [Hyphomicrobiales bacterium]CAI0344601.1 hypothetical protein BO1005MUT1_340018 [Hyphomicrobiales bacterium]